MVDCNQRYSALFNKTPKPQGNLGSPGNPGIEPDRSGPEHEDMSGKSTEEVLQHIKDYPKQDQGSPDPRLHHLNSRGFF
jgi:hypothetical protein